jgi:hypothetical protein
MPSDAQGRPPRQVRQTIRRPGWYGCEQVVAWLLRVNRLYGRDEKFTSLKRFTAAFQGGSWPDPVSASQISRWETAAARAGFNVVRRYEEMLGLPYGRLVAVADWAYRKASDSAGPPVLHRGLDPADPHMHDRTHELLDQALSAGLMTGMDWDELTSHLAALPTAFLHPRAAWADLAERLLAELLISDGPAWLFRTEALARLMGHPRAGSPIIAACAALASDPANQIVIEPLTILDLTADRDANRHVLRQVEHPVSDRSLRGALLAAIEKIPRRHFRAAALRSLAATAAELAAVAELHSEVRHLAATLLHQLPASQLGPAFERLSRAADPTTRDVLSYGQTASAVAAGRVVTRIGTAAATRMPRHPIAGPDPMLSHLLTELLFSPNQNDRLLAGLVIAATPYRDVVGAALATELAAAPTARMVPLTTALIAAMPHVGRSADRPTVEWFVTAPGLAAPISDTAAWMIGHVPGHSDRRFWSAAISTHTRAWQATRNPGAISALRGLTYALGIGGYDDMLDAIRADTRVPAATRAAARWWLNIPASIHASAVR